MSQIPNLRIGIKSPTKWPLERVGLRRLIVIVIVIGLLIQFLGLGPLRVADGFLKDIVRRK